MHKLIRTLGFAMLALPLASCRLVYTPNVQQGNLFNKSVDQKSLDQLKPGLTKEQVLALLGTPSVASPFEHDRWDYVSTYSHRGGPMQVHAMSLYFDNDTLVRTEGAMFAENTKQLLKENQKYHVNYPVNETEGDKSETKKDKPAISVGGTSGLPDNGKNGKP
jgi:outer membrane protein assembly factor BamE